MPSTIAIRIHAACGMLLREGCARICERPAPAWAMSAMGESPVARDACNLCPGAGSVNGPKGQFHEHDALEIAGQHRGVLVVLHAAAVVWRHLDEARGAIQRVGGRQEPQALEP